MITLIGSGNVATHLAKILTIKGFFIYEIFSKNIENAKILVKEIKNFQKKNKKGNKKGDKNTSKNTEKKSKNSNHKNTKKFTIATDSLDFSQSKSKLFILAIKDIFFEEVVANIQLPKNVILVHTSGSMPLNLLAPLTEKNVKIGVFYPLQTFSKEKKEILEKNIKKITKNIIEFWENIPICLQTNEQEINKFLYEIAKKITSKIYQINSEQRQILHLGATFACNFSNYMYHIAKEILQKNELPFEMLENLVKETANKAFLMPPLEAQTGVARRGDMNIIALHQQKLVEIPEIKDLYTQITKQILDLYHKKE